MEFKTRWQKWQDPFAQVLKDVDTDDDEQLPFEKYEDKKNFSGPMICGHFGVVPIHEGNIPSKLFNFWRIDTNFPFTKDMQSLLDNIDGVETVDIMTPYRARIGIAQLFEEKSIMREIDQQLIKRAKLKKESRDETLFTILNAQWSYWAVVYINNDKNIISGNTADEVNDKIHDLEKEYNLDKIVYSWEYNAKNKKN